MCGILGAFGDLKKERFEKALETLSHRGPDFSGVYEGENILFGHTRLSIIDPFPEANQPFLVDNTVAVFNGEIYNYKELVQKHSLNLRTKSDTEALVKLYGKLGIDFLNELNGMFAFCIYDKQQQKLVLARDRFGKKPLYYFFDAGKFIFASEIKAILKMLDFRPEINRRAFDEYLTYLSPTENKTFYSGIFKLQPGEKAIFDIESKTLEISQYYDLKNSTNIIDISQKEALEKIESLLLQSIDYRLVSDVPVASFLSGGIDSTLISALYASASEQKIDTFSIGYDEYKVYDELEYAHLAASSMGSNHHEVVASRKDFLDAFEKIIDTLDEPLNDPAIIPTFMLSKEVHKSGYKTILSGEGSDEIFMGYDAYFDYQKLQKISDELSIQSKNFLAVHHNQNQNLSRNWEYLRRVYENDFPIFRLTGECFNPLQKSRLLKYDFDDMDEHKKYLYSKVSDRDASYWMSYADMKHWIGEVLMTKMDRMSMAHSLESRAPFLDYKLVEFVMSLPSAMREGDTTKSLLKKIALKHIPQEIVYRQKKGFSSPHFEWYYGTYKDKILADLRLVNDELGWFNDEFLSFLYKEGKIGKFKQHLWGLIVFSRWFIKRFM